MLFSLCKLVVFLYKKHDLLFCFVLATNFSKISKNSRKLILQKEVPISSVVLFARVSVKSRYRNATYEPCP